MEYRDFYIQGSLTGLAGFGPASIRRAGLKRAIGFITQPVENWSRYPELKAVHSLLKSDLANARHVLDIGSPKMFGILLAKEFPNAQFILTDIWPRALSEVGEYAARTTNIQLEPADGTNLENYPDESFDAVYSASVIEHIPGDENDLLCMKETYRVLRKGGLMVFSVPCSDAFRKDYFRGDIYGQRSGETPAFFQRIYDQKHLQRLIDCCPWNLEGGFLSVWPQQNIPIKIWSKVHTKLRGLFGFVYLLLAHSGGSLMPYPEKAISGPGDVIIALRK